MTLNKPSGWEDWIGTVKQGDCLDLMKQMQEGVVHCVVTSPPYFGLRDYGTAKWEGGDPKCDHKAPDEAGQTLKPTAGQRTHAGRFAGSTCWKCGARRVDPQMGLEKTPELYIAKMVEVFREVKRIMHPTGVLWLNMGDSYASGGGEGKNRYFDGRKEEFGPGNRPKGSSRLMKNTGLKPKDLLEMPSRLVLALQADGWWLRSRIPWLKRNAMPESTDDRPTQAVEYIFLLTKSGTPQYWTHRDKDGVTEQPKADWRWVNAVTQEETTEAPPDWKEIITCPRCEGTGIADIPFEYEVFGETVFEVHKGECPVCDGKKEIQRWKRVNLWRGHDYFYDGEAVRVKQTGTAHSKGKKLHPPIEDAGVGHKDWHKYTPDTVLPHGRSRRNSDAFFESWRGDYEQDMYDVRRKKTADGVLPRQKGAGQIQGEVQNLSQGSGAATPRKGEEHPRIQRTGEGLEQTTLFEKPRPLPSKEKGVQSDRTGEGKSQEVSAEQTGKDIDSKGKCATPKPEATPESTNPETMGKDTSGVQSMLRILRGEQQEADTGSSNTTNDGRRTHNGKRSPGVSAVQLPKAQQGTPSMDGGSGSGLGKTRSNSPGDRIDYESWQGLWTDENGEPLAFIVNPKPYKRAHFATFSPGLVIPCIRAGTSERGACPECGSPWARVVEKSGETPRQKQSHRGLSDYAQGQPKSPQGLDYAGGHDNNLRPTQTLGWRATCSCSKEPVPCLAFDPFAGTGTVIEVARKMGRSGLGFEISEEYVKKYCQERLAQGVLDLSKTPE